jgi:hypothetical protein
MRLFLTGRLLEPVIIGNSAVLSSAPRCLYFFLQHSALILLPLAFLYDIPVQGGTVGTGLATCKYLWKSGLRLLHVTQYVPCRICTGSLVEALGGEEDS